MATNRAVTNGMFDSFAGPASELPPGKRTPSHVLAALRINPRVGTFDMSETPWLRGCIDSLKNSGHIVEDKDEPYPWHLFLVQPKDPPMTTTPNPGTADLPEAGCSKHHLIHCSQCRHDNMVRDLMAENDRLTTQLATLAAGQGVAYVALPEPADIIAGALQISRGHAYELMREAVATDASHGQAPAGAAQAADSVQEDAARPDTDAAFEAARRCLCKIPRYSFALDSRGNVRRCEDKSGNWIEFDAAHALFDPVSVDAARKQGGA